MSVPLSIDGGYNGYDPIREVIGGELRQRRQIDPAVSERCEEVYKETLTLISKVEGSAARLGQYTVTLTTPTINYDTHTQDSDFSGFVWLQQKFYRPDDSALTFTSETSRVGLLAGARDDVNLANRLFSLSPHDILYRHDIFFKVGSHAELNFFWNVVTKVRESAFPKNKALEQERLNDIEADTRHRQQAATD
jgi:hypothetical protein